MKLKANLGADGAVLLTTLIWGSSFSVSRGILDEWPPLAYLAVRMTLATLVFAALFPRQLAGARRGAWKAGGVLGLLIGVGFIGQTSGLLYTTPARLAFVTGLTTPLVPVVAYLLLRARPSRENLAGVLLASIGGALILAPSGERGVNLGDLITLGCTLLFAAHITLLSVYARRFDPRQLSLIQIATVAGLTVTAWAAARVLAAAAGGDGLPAWAARETAALAWRPGVVAAILYMVLVGTVGTFLLWTWGQARMSASHAAVIFALEPVFATLFAVWLRGTAEWTGARATVGAVLVVVAVVVSELRLGGRAEGDEELAAGEAGGV
ncbi:MAG TPA: DMT family transporter [Pyrinomonadaceae bacterium]|nr:DMT family transporter [Pyrinomonadaceae bacterium]